MHKPTLCLGLIAVGAIAFVVLLAGRDSSGSVSVLGMPYLSSTGGIKSMAASSPLSIAHNYKSSPTLTRTTNQLGREDYTIIPGASAYWGKTSRSSSSSSSSERDVRSFAKKRRTRPGQAAILAARSGGRVGGAVRPRSGGGRMSSGRSRSLGGSRRSMGGGGIAPMPSYGPNVYINPYPSPFFSPFFNPFFGGFGGIGFATPLPLNVLALGALGLVAFRTLRSQAAFLEATTGTVMMLQVAVYCGDRSPNSLFGRLNTLAQTAETWSEEGLQSLVQESSLALLRSEEDWVAGRSQTFQRNPLGNGNDVESAFNQALLKERAKFEEENNSGRRQIGGGAGKPSHMVVTIMVALRDAPDLPQVRGLNDMRSALGMIGARSGIEDNLLAAEVLWTPEDPGDSMSREEVFMKFPELIDL